MPARYQTLISVDDFSRILGDDHIAIVDCRFYLDDVNKGRKEFIKSHIPGAFYLDLTLDLSAPVVKGVTGRHPLPHTEILASTLRAAGMDQNSQVIVYDQSNGAYASRGWWLLRWLGHKDVAVLDGGFEAWNEMNGPYDNQWPLPLSGNFKPNVMSHLVVNRTDIGFLPNPLVDSREYRRYTGEFEPIDPVAGHIPGAICLPYMSNNTEKGHWKSQEELKNIFSPLTNSSDVPVFYCGSGVTACHNILAYNIATGKDALLYPGSWSEWILYDNNPATG